MRSNSSTLITLFENLSYITLLHRKKIAVCIKKKLSYYLFLVHIETIIIISNKFEENKPDVQLVFIKNSNNFFFFCDQILLAWLR